MNLHRSLKTVSAVCQLVETVSSSLHFSTSSRAITPKLFCARKLLSNNESQMVAGPRLNDELYVLQFSHSIPKHCHHTLSFVPKTNVIPLQTLKLKKYNSLLPLFFSCHLITCNNFNGSKSQKPFLREIKSHLSYSTYTKSRLHKSNLGPLFHCSLPGSFRLNFSQPVIHPPKPQHQINHILIRTKHTKPKVPPTKIAQVYDFEGAITDEEAAEQFVFALKANERKHLYAELAKYQSVDSTNTQASPPTRRQLQQVVLHQTFPFLGFGFLDNLLMIVAGEYIDVTLGAAFGISTMAAAALGNLISDVGGLGSAHYVETLAARFGVRNPHLSPEQVDMRRTKWASNLGKFIGVTIGCLLGMFPLLFFHDKKTDSSKEDDDDDAKVNEQKDVKANIGKKTQSV